MGVEGDRKKAAFQPIAGVSCTYQVQSIDGVPGEPAGYTSGEALIFDEMASISYSCTFSPELPGKADPAVGAPDPGATAGRIGAMRDVVGAVQ